MFQRFPVVLAATLPLQKYAAFKSSSQAMPQDLAR